MHFMDIFNKLYRTDEPNTYETEAWIVYWGKMYDIIINHLKII